MTDYDVVCLSHLRWDWVWQRPQHQPLRAVEPSLLRGGGGRRWRHPDRRRGDVLRRARRSASRSGGAVAARARRRPADVAGRAVRPVRDLGLPPVGVRADGDGLRGAPEARRDGLRLHGRALVVCRRAAGAARARGATAQVRGPRVHGWPKPVRGKARLPSQRLLLPVECRRGALRAGADVGCGRSTRRRSAPAHRFCRRDRRARRPRARRASGGCPARLAGSAGRTGHEDRRVLCAPATEHPPPGREGVRRAAVVPRALGRCLDAVRTERCDALHQPHEDARVPGRRQAGGLDPDPRRVAALRRRRCRPHRRGRRGDDRRRRALTRLRPGLASAPRRRRPGADLVGADME